MADPATTPTPQHPFPGRTPVCEFCGRQDWIILNFHIGPSGLYGFAYCSGQHGGEGKYYRVYVRDTYCSFYDLTLYTFKDT